MKRVLASFLILGTMNADNNYSNPWTASYRKPNNVSKVDLCREFQDEQSRNVVKLLAAYQLVEQEYLRTLCLRIKTELEEQYRQASEKYKSQKSQEWRAARLIWASTLVEPAEPNDSIIDEQVQQAFNDKKDDPIVAAILANRERQAYYTTQYLTDREQLKKLTKMQIAALFAHKKEVLQKKGGIIQLEKQEGRYPSGGIHIVDYDIVAAKNGDRISSDVCYPIGLVLVNGTCKVEQLLQEESRVEENNHDTEVDMGEAWFFTE